MLRLSWPRGGEGDARDFPSRAPSAPCVSRGIILNHTRSSRDIRSSTRRAPIFGTLARLYDCVRTEGPCHDPEIAELARPRCAVDGCRGGVPADAGSDLCAGARSARAAQRHHVVPGLRPARHDADHSGFWSDRPRWQQSARRKGRDLPVAGRGVGRARHRLGPHRQARHVCQQRGGCRRQCGDDR